MDVRDFTLEERGPLHWMNIQRHGIDSGHHGRDNKLIYRELDHRDYHHTGGNKQNIMGHFKWGRRELAEHLARELTDAIRSRYYESLESRAYFEWEELDDREEDNEVRCSLLFDEDILIILQVHRREPSPRHLHIGVEVKDYHL